MQGYKREDEQTDGKRKGHRAYRDRQVPGGDRLLQGETAGRRKRYKHKVQPGHEEGGLHEADGSRIPKIHIEDAVIGNNCLIKQFISDHLPEESLLVD